jgi:hypothetical protein
VISLTATPDTGSAFDGWTGCDSTSGTQCTVTMIKAKSVTAEFRLVTAVKMLSPNSGESINSGSIHQVEWEAPVEAVKFKLSYSVDNGITWKKVHTEPFIMGSSFDWTVPIPSNNKRKCLLKVVGYNEKGKIVGTDKSDVPFGIEVVKLIFPNGGESLVTNGTPNITWKTNQTKTDVTKVVLSYTLNGGVNWNPIETLKQGPYPPADNYIYPWTPPSVGTTPKTKCKVKVVLKDAAGNVVGSDTSDGFFTIRRP